MQSVTSGACEALILAMPHAGTSASLLIVAVILALLLAADSFFIICAAQGEGRQWAPSIAPSSPTGRQQTGA